MRLHGGRSRAELEDPTLPGLRTELDPQGTAGPAMQVRTLVMAAALALLTAALLATIWLP